MNDQASFGTLAGSFLRSVLETRGAVAMRSVYRKANVEGALGKPFATLEAEWKRHLESIPLPKSAQGLAKLRFERPSVFSQICPNAVERLSQTRCPGPSRL